MTARIVFYLVFLLISLNTLSQSKTLKAVKASSPPRIDGNLEDEVWKTATIATDFIQNFPQTGEPASAKTEIRILYDDNAIYIGAMLYDDPGLIRKQLTSRDGEGRSDVDYFSVFFDTYNDKQNGFQFLVTSVNVQTDAKLAPSDQLDFGEFGDKSWDAVWESKTAFTDSGWIAEMKIPYLSLRFPKKDVQDWGIQFLRFLRRNNESSYWNFVDPNINGFVNQFGMYSDIRDLEPPLRLSFSPYVTGGVRVAPEQGIQRTDWLQRGGMDMKYGLSESFTLDATLIPDFGQVISDNVVLNLSPFEVQFQENRPFFTEGTELFNKAGLFYSRRVGGTPPGFYGVRNLVNADPNLELIKNPSVTQLYNAMKFSGRNRKKLGIGIFNAVTAPMHAEVRNKTSGDEFRIRTGDVSNYNILVLDQALKNRSSITLTNTNVIRNGAQRDANVTALDFSVFDKKNTYTLSGSVRYSSIFFGDNSFDGHNFNLQFKKIRGNFQFNAGANAISDDYDPNDMGFQLKPNDVNYSAGFGYYQFVPKGNFLLYNYRYTMSYRWLYKPYRFTRLENRITGFWVFRNFWDLTLSAGILPNGENDYFELRSAGRYVKKPYYWYNILSGSSDSRKKLFHYFEYQWGWGKGSGYPFSYYVASLGFRYRFGNKLTMDISSDRNVEWGQVGYVFANEVNGEPIAGRRVYTEVTSLFSGQYNFTSRLNLSFRIRHYWSHVVYQTLHNVSPETGKLIPRAFSTPIPDPNENFNVFNLDAFLTWDFRLGSRVIVGWKNFLGDEEYVDGIANRKYLSNLHETFNLLHGNEVTVRFIYFLDYNQLRKKR